MVVLNYILVIVVKQFIDIIVN